MNDAFYEQLVTRKTKPLDILIRILIIVFIAAVAVEIGRASCRERV